MTGQIKISSFFKICAGIMVEIFATIFVMAVVFAVGFLILLGIK